MKPLRPFNIYRVICTKTSKALLSGWADCPNTKYEWYERGGGCGWGPSGSFWRTEHGVNKQLYRLCCDWGWNWENGRFRDPVGPEKVKIAGPYWDRLLLLNVEKTIISNYSVAEIPASDFMGIMEASQ